MFQAFKRHLASPAVEIEWRINSAGGRLCVRFSWLYAAILVMAICWAATAAL